VGEAAGVAAAVGGQVTFQRGRHPKSKRGKKNPTNEQSHVNLQFCD
jgi:hypothetical protein